MKKMIFTVMLLFVSFCAQHACETSTNTVITREYVLKIIPDLHANKRTLDKHEISEIAKQITAKPNKKIVQALRLSKTIGTATCFLHYPELADAVCLTILNNKTLITSCEEKCNINNLIPLTINATSFSLRLKLLTELLQAYDADAFESISKFFHTMQMSHGNKLLLPFAFLYAKSDNCSASSFIADIKLSNQFLWYDYSYSLIEDEALHPCILDGLASLPIDTIRMPIIEQIAHFTHNNKKESDIFEYREDAHTELYKAKQKMRTLLKKNMTQHKYKGEMKRRLDKTLLLLPEQSQR